ncbi:MAG: CBS domain-containing protein [Deltaproteobacteria bacterium]|jgi:CBS domain-containing protein|nr:CBS domain-containing protein [Deltaproteobacteria bacterium]
MEIMEPCRTASEVSDLMTPDPVTVLPTTPVGEVWRIMAERRFRHMLVSEESSGLLGLVSQRDILAGAQSADLRIESDVRPIRELMIRSVDTVRPECCAAEAARYMLSSKRSCLPVVDDSGALVGILTEADFMRLATRGVPPCTCGGVTVGA